MLGCNQSSRKPVLKLVQSRLVGSTIISDEWRAYFQRLTEHGYTHHTVNHSRNFVDGYTGAHTQHIERAWGQFKSNIWRLRGNMTEKLLKEHLQVIEWTYWLTKKHKKMSL